MMGGGTVSKAMVDEVYELGRREGWDAAIDRVAGLIEDDLLTERPEALEAFASLVRMRRNVQSLRKRNPAVASGVHDAEVAAAQRQGPRVPMTQDPGYVPSTAPVVSPELAKLHADAMAARPEGMIGTVGRVLEGPQRGE